LDAAGCGAAAVEESDFRASSADAAVDAGLAGELAGFVADAGAVEAGAPEAGVVDVGPAEVGAGEDGVAFESAAAGCDPAAGLGFVACEALAVPEDDGAGVLESGACEVSVAALFVPEISQPSP